MALLSVNSRQNPKQYHRMGDGVEGVVRFGLRSDLKIVNGSRSCVGFVAGCQRSQAASAADLEASKHRESKGNGIVGKRVSI
jgi:hypothetical protein